MKRKQASFLLCWLIFCFNHLIFIDSFSFSIKNLFNFESKSSQEKQSNSEVAKGPRQFKKPYIPEPLIKNVGDYVADELTDDPPIFYYPEHFDPKTPPHPVPKGYKKMTWDDFAKHFPEEMSPREWKAVELEYKKRMNDPPERFNEFRYKELLEEFGLFDTDNYWDQGKKIIDNKLKSCKTPEEKKALKEKITEFEMLTLKKQWYYNNPTKEMYEQDYSRFYDKRVAGWEYFVNIPPERLIHEAVAAVEAESMRERNNNRFHDGDDDDSYAKRLALKRPRGLLYKILPSKIFDYYDFLQTLKRKESLTLNQYGILGIFLAWFIFRISSSLNSASHLFSFFSAYVTLGSLFVANSSLANRSSRRNQNPLMLLISGIFSLFENMKLPAFQFATGLTILLTSIITPLSYFLLNFIQMLSISTKTTSLSRIPSQRFNQPQAIPSFYLPFLAKLNLSLLIALIFSTFYIHQFFLYDKLPRLWNNYLDQKVIINSYYENEKLEKQSIQLEDDLNNHTLVCYRDPKIEKQFETLKFGEKRSSDAGLYNYPLFEEYDYEYDPDYETDAGLEINEDGEIIPPKGFEYYDEYFDHLKRTIPGFGIEPFPYFKDDYKTFNDSDLNAAQKDYLENVAPYELANVKETALENLRKGIDPLEEKLKEWCIKNKRKYTPELYEKIKQIGKEKRSPHGKLTPAELGVSQYIFNQMMKTNNDSRFDFVDEAMAQDRLRQQYLVRFLSGHEIDPGAKQGKFIEYEPNPDFNRPNRPKFIGPFGFREKNPDWLIEIEGKDTTTTEDLIREYKSKTSFGRHELVAEGHPEIKLTKTDKMKIPGENYDDEFDEDETGQPEDYDEDANYEDDDEDYDGLDEYGEEIKPTKEEVYYPWDEGQEIEDEYEPEEHAELEDYDEDEGEPDFIDPDKDEEKKDDEPTKKHKKKK